jgi:hypothetical protein
MNDMPACAVARSSRGDRTTHAPGDPRRTVVVDPRRGHWDLVTILRLRVARPRLDIRFARRPTDAAGIAAAFRAGAYAYVLGSGDPEADCAFVRDECDVPPFGPARESPVDGAR